MALEYNKRHSNQHTIAHTVLAMSKLCHSCDKIALFLFILCLAGPESVQWLRSGHCQVYTCVFATVNRIFFDLCQKQLSLEHRNQLLSNIMCTAYIKQDCAVCALHLISQVTQTLKKSFNEGNVNNNEKVEYISVCSLFWKWKNRARE